VEQKKEANMRQLGGLVLSAMVIPLVLLGALSVGCNSSNDALGSGGGSGRSVNLGSAAGFGVLAGQAVSNSGATTVNTNLGIWPGNTLTGAPTVTGTTHLGDTTSQSAQGALTAAYNDAAGRAAGSTIAGDLGGMTLAPGVRKSTSTLEITSADVTLDAGGNPDAVFIFQIASSLTVGVGRQVILSGGAQPANIFWQVGSSATLNSNCSVSGNIIALTTITLGTGATLNGRAMARNGDVTLLANVITP
jgi:ice-binding like protein